ncbi:hypothetical protein ACFVUS_08950 [Nocardia sp. NPDC058058]|uniref:hypothetical protein n=1 Tax=Nocardia sp. NPDC058058 TaxID=3346317 RepID=UPI0036D80638
MMTAPPIFQGDFEAHLTVRADDATSLAALERHAAAQELKFTHIRLARGRVRDQPMLTARYSGTFASVRDSVAELAARLTGAGFPLCRTKIESTPWATGVPVTAAEALALGPGYYFEHHVKLVLDPQADPAALTAIAVAHAAHLSANARRVRSDGRAERFVTQRCRSVGDPVADARLRDLLTALTVGNYEIQSVEREFVVYDSDESIDDGWIDENGEPS